MTIIIVELSFDVLVSLMIGGTMAAFLVTALADMTFGYINVAYNVPLGEVMKVLAEVLLVNEGFVVILVFTLLQKTGKLNKGELFG